MKHILVHLIFLVTIVSSKVVYADDECLSGHQGGRTFIQKDLENESENREDSGDSIAK